MTVNHIGSFTMDGHFKDEFVKDGNYGGRYRLPDGTEVNVVTRIVGPGLGAETDIEADRELTDEEMDAVGTEDSSHDHGTPTIDYRPMTIQAQY